MSSPIGRIRSGIANAGSPDPDAHGVADRAAQVWTGIHVVLSPIIGHGGVVALYQRSLHLTRRVHPGLADVSAGDTRSPWQDLHAALSAMPSNEALAAADALVQTFRGLLGTLIGATLTERLLESIPDIPLSGGAAPEAAS